jgi:4-coumarate--CoA ligase (photoactive yellow protein activation family)
MIQTTNVADASMIGRAQLRRLLLSQIEAFQERLVRNGRLSEASLISAQVARRDADGLDKMIIGEADLGLDSLDRLELVVSLTRYYGLGATGVEDYMLVRRRFEDWLDLIELHFRKIGHGAVISFSTSGSTGAAKVFSHRRAALESEMQVVVSERIVSLSPGSRVITMVPSHHVYGFLWTVLLPELCGASVIDLTKTAPSAMFRTARPGDLIVATPYGWDQLRQSGGRLPANVTGITSGGPTTAATWQTAQDIGLTQLIEIYGSTETGGVGWRRESTLDFTLLDDIERNDDGLLRCGLLLDLQDRIDWTGPRGFRVLGRRDNVVQVAGTNVNIDVLRGRILDATGAEDAALRLSDDRLKAFIAVPTQKEDGVRQALHKLLSQLPAPERPAEIRFGTALPRTAIGKLANW